MALPTSTTWDIADFYGAAFADLTTASSDVGILPMDTTAFALNAAETGLEVRSSDGVLATLRLIVGMPPRFTLQLVLRCPQLPHNLGDLEARRFGLTLADDAGRGFSIYFAKTGVAVSRIDNFGAMTALPDTSDVTRAVASTYFTVRIAVDGGLGRAYVFLAEGVTDFPPLRYIVPVEASPEGLGDTVRLEAKGLVSEPVLVEIAQLRVGSDLVLANYPPVADAGPDRAAPLGSAVRLDGRASYDVEGSPLAYRWRCIDAPYGSAFVHEVSEVTTTDDGDADGLTIVLSAAPATLPSWLQPGDIVRVAGGTYELERVDLSTGTLETTMDALPDDLAAPARFVRQSILLDAESPTPVVVPDAAGVFRFQLVVGDGDNLSEPSEVLANISPLQTPFGIEPDVSSIWKALGDEWRYIEGRDVFEEAWIGTAQILSGKLLEAWQTHYGTSIRDVPRVYQRKWLAFRTFVPETAIDTAEVSARLGGFTATHPFDAADIALSGKVLVVERLDADAAFVPVAVSFDDTYALGAVVTVINTALAAAGVIDIVAEARNLRTAGNAPRLLVYGTVAFRLSGNAAELLGLDMGVINALGGTTGARITDRTYYAEGVDLVAAGVQRGDLLVVNNGESLRIDRVLTDPTDPHPNQRLLLFDEVALDATATWSIPSVVRSRAVDYEREGAYPGDLAKVEIGAADDQDVVEENAWVVGQKGSQLAVTLGVKALAALTTDVAVRLLGLKRRKAVPLPADVVSVPALQEVIAERLSPTRLHEHVDYILEPFYRETGGRPLPMLQFVDSVFIEPDLEPPDVLWAETVLFDNEVNVERLFGELVGFKRDDAAGFPRDFNYVAGVAGLLYARQRGPNFFAMSVGAQILLGQPFAEVAGFIEEIRPLYSPTQGRILVRDDDGNRPTTSETVRAYYYKKNPADLSEFSGIVENPTTGARWAAGDFVPQFSPLGVGITLEDVYTKPNWWRIYAGAGAMAEVEKYHRFACTFDLRLVDIANMSLLASLLQQVKPTYNRLMLVGDTARSDDLDPQDATDPVVHLLPYDTPLAHYGVRYDDYRGDGTITHAHDDGVTRFDALVDSIIETIEFVMTINWPGGVLTFPTSWPFSLANSVVDVNGAETGSPGASFSLTNGMDLAAGTYRTSAVVRSGPILPPL